MVFRTNCDKIRRGNYKGLNMTDFRISLLGQVDIAESNIREAKELGLDRDESRDAQRKYQDLVKKKDELKDLQRKVN